MSKEGDEAVARMRAVYDESRKLMVNLMRDVGFGIPVMPQGAFYVFADASRWNDDSYAFAFELLEKPCVGVAPGVDFGQVGGGGEVHPRIASSLSSLAIPLIPPGRNTTSTLPS